MSARANPSVFPSRPERNRLLRAWTGPLTERLRRLPAAFGIGQAPAARLPDSVASSVCGYCSTGCALQLRFRRGEAVGLGADPAYPVNRGMACPKGWEALAPLDAPDRGRAPLARGADGVRRPLSWETALGRMVARFKAIQTRCGPDALAWLGTGQMPTEELAFLGALAKFGMGIRHGDGNTRQCMATAVSAYKESFGFDAPPYTYADFEESDLIVLIGSNLCIAHPILWQRILANPRRPEIVVVDPRATETAMAATRHYAPRPKSDLVLLYALARQLIANGAVDGRFVDASTRGFDEFSSFVEPFVPERAAAETGIAAARIVELARLVGGAERASFWWTMGVNQSHEGTRTAQAIVNLALMTGNVGKPGTGPNSVTGQCNAMGSRLFSNTTCLFGGRDFADRAARKEVASILDFPESAIPSSPSMAYDEIVEAIDRGVVKGLWVVATNPAHSWIDQNRCRELLAKLDFLVVQDMYPTSDTARLADLYLPAAGWGEKEGTFINSERRLGRVRKARSAPGQALPDFRVFQRIAAAWGCGERFRSWSRPEAVFQKLKALSAGLPCDFTGIRDYAHLDAAGGIQWPYAAAQAAADAAECASIPRRAERRLFADGRFFTPDGKARFVFAAPAPVPEPIDGDYPFLLLTGRGTSAQWHTQTRTAKSAVLRKLYPELIYVEINEADARRLGVDPGARVAVETRRGRLEAAAWPCQTVRPGQLFIPMHYPEANRLTHPSFDAYSRQPAYKACAARLTLSTSTQARL